MSSQDTKLNGLFALSVTLSKMSIKFVRTVVLKWGNISVQSASSLMMISQRNNIIVMIVAYAG
jgi:hypothetical protein